MEQYSQEIYHNISHSRIELMEALPSTNWILIGLTVFLLLATWLANCILLGGAFQTASSGRIVPVAYFFIGSQAIAALLYVTLNLPPAVIGLLFGSSHTQAHIHVFCLYSTYLDTLFCNLTFLQTFFSSLDAYLRLRNPTFYLTSARRRPALWLKVGSPWLVGGLQAIGQLALSDREQVSLHFGPQMNSNGRMTVLSSLQTTCLLPDPNFLIIRTAIAYALPLVICIVLVGLQLRCLRRLRYYPIDALQALIQVRSGINGTSLVKRQSSSIRTFPYTNDAQHSLRYEQNSSRQIILPDHGNKTLIRTGNQCSPDARINNDHQLLTDSFNLESQYTFDTLVPEGTISSQQLQRLNSTYPLLTQSSISHVILPTSTIPYFELHPIDPTGGAADILYATNSTSVFTCPTHGSVSVAMTAESENETNQTKVFDVTKKEPQTNINVKSDLPRNIVNNVTNNEVSSLSVDARSTSNLVAVNNVTSEPVSEAGNLKQKRVDLIWSTIQRPPVKSDSNYSMPASLTLRSNTQDFVASNEVDNDVLQLKSPPFTVHTHEKEGYLRASTPLWLTAYHGEQLAVAINLVSCIIAVGTWSPFILSTLAHGLCQPLKIPTSVSTRPVYTMHPSLLNLPTSPPPSRCLIQVTPDRIADFRWWAYASMGLLLPCLLFFLDLGLREGCWRALRYADGADSAQSLTHKMHQRKLCENQNALQATNTKQTYRCNDPKNSQNIYSNRSGKRSSREAVQLDELWRKPVAQQVNTLVTDSLQNQQGFGKNS